MFGEVRVVDDVADAFVSVVNDAAPSTLALSGGETARRCYEHLRTAGKLEWEQVEILLSDERFIPVDSPDSNEGMVRRALTDHEPVAALYSMTRAGRDIEEAALNYEAVIRSLPSGIDVVHLGVGPDGHTASLFPGSPALEERERLVVATGDDLHPHPRLTFTFAAIAMADLAVVTIEGEEKRDAWRRIQAADTTAPAARIRARSVIWLVNSVVAGI
jgi:6-phosphogluconolactonase